MEGPRDFSETSKWRRMKNDLLELLCALGFGLVPIAVLAIRAFRPRFMPWWAVFGVTVGIGWGLAVASAWIHEGPDTGAGHVGALFFGWALALLWLLPWLIVYAIVQGVRRFLTRQARGQPVRPDPSAPDPGSGI